MSEKPTIGKLIVDGEYTVDVTKKDLKILKGLMMTIETDICKEVLINVREAQERDPRLKTLYKLLGY